MDDFDSHPERVTVPAQKLNQLFDCIPAGDHINMAWIRMHLHYRNHGWLERMRWIFRRASIGVVNL